MRDLCRILVLLQISWLVASCGGDDEPGPMEDAGVDDATPGDADEGDAAIDDAGEPDAPIDLDAGPPPECGNFELEGDEVCDDGNTEGGDGCSPDCMSNEACGNMYLDEHLGEYCDDGNTVNGDGCSADCLSDETCGNGITDIGVGEVCDDGNTDDGDGCSADCSMGPVCGDGSVNGAEACDDGNTDGGDGCSADCSSDETCGNGVVDVALGEGCDDGNTVGGDGCSPACSVEACGNGILDAGEDCDDDNDANGDGCDNDCTFSCSADADCDDSAPCNGSETCNTTTHVCAPGTNAANGTDCGGGLVCRSGACVAPVCGNSIVEASEACDDGNMVDGDGCDNDCTFSCTLDSECTDGQVCTGDETCNTTTHTCTNPPDLASGTACGTDLVCRAGSCVGIVCGDGMREGSEICDDGNALDGDGCDSDCTWSCSTNAECNDGQVCTGDETCNTTTHTCTNPADLADGTACGTDLVCRTGACVGVVCGDGRAEGSEQCDDGNSVSGDGCDNDCTWSCSTNAECDDGLLCNGIETCNTSTHVCRNPADAADGTSCGTDMVCRSGVCTTTVCGNGLTEGSEDCDDGNSTNGDGCDNDCTWSCTTNADCSDGLTCNGSETCNTTTHVCAAGSPQANGTTCDRDMNPGTRDICQSAICVASTCGDGFADTSGTEECDDGNTTNGDGCQNDCTWTCETNAECSDGRLCNGAETCNTTSHTCSAGTAASDGTVCDRDGMSATRDICRSATCVASACGDGFVDSAVEECDDGNTTSGDGCQSNCTWTCETNAECTDGNACNGGETCNTTTHLCQGGTPPGDGTVCDRDMNASTRDICRGASCLASSCGDGYVDTGGGEQCEDGNTVNGDGCDNDCTWTCTAAADCNDGRVCNGTESCNTSTHMCVAGTPAADGTLCDRDMSAATRDICRTGTCRASTCGDGWLDTGAGEACDDGNTVSGDGCQADCTVTGATPPTAFRITQLDLRDPHIYADIIGCNDVTESGPFGIGDGVNDSLNAEVDAYNLNYVNVFRPLDITAASTPMDFVSGECMAGTPRDVCQVGAGIVYPTTAHNSPSGSLCFTALAGTVRPYSPPVNTVSGPCFVTDPENITVSMGGVAVPLRDARIAATYSGGSPPTTLVSGVVSGFLTETDARAIVFPAGTPLVAGDTLYEHLADGGAPGSSCSGRDDSDTHMGVNGFWFYLNFTANLADWTGP